jgi:hypothetical protein
MQKEKEDLQRQVDEEQEQKEGLMINVAIRCVSNRPSALYRAVRPRCSLSVPRALSHPGHF